MMDVLAVNVYTSREEYVVLATALGTAAVYERKYDGVVDINTVPEPPAPPL
jgi:hypothetical protein